MYSSRTKTPIRELQGVSFYSQTSQTGLKQDNQVNQENYRQAKCK